MEQKALTWSRTVCTQNLVYQPTWATKQWGVGAVLQSILLYRAVAGISLNLLDKHGHRHVSMILSNLRRRWEVLGTSVDLYTGSSAAEYVGAHCKIVVLSFYPIKANLRHSADFCNECTFPFPLSLWKYHKHETVICHEFGVLPPAWAGNMVPLLWNRNKKVKITRGTR